jgi:PPOX class probable F420-dependent enzyme
MAVRTEPKAGRPHMPGYGISTARKGLLPWSWAVERLAANRNYFVATTRPDGAPHVAPVWGVWLDNQLLFSTSGTSRKARNITADPRCVITTERADEVVIVEGVAETAKDGPLLKRFVAAYKEKYDWDMETGTESGPIYAVRPSKVFGFIEHSDQFPTTATRWTF